MKATALITGGSGGLGTAASDGIRANAVLPGVIDTPANRAAQPGADYSSWVTPDRIARVIHFLCEGSSDAISGAHIPVHGTA